MSKSRLVFFKINGGDTEIQSDSNKISLFSFHFFQCSAKVSDYQAVGLSMRFCYDIIIYILREVE